MAHYAILDQDGIVTFVHPGRNEGEDGIDWEEYYGAVRTSYNTYGGVHTNGGVPFRHNYASVGYSFDPDFGPDGAFIPPQPFPSWTLNQETALWDSPVPYPTDGSVYRWDEPTLSWVEATA